MVLPIDEYLRFARRLAHAGGEIIQKYFRSDVAVDTKPDQTPVTIADREAEKVMRDMIHKRYPRHGIIGEEFQDNREGMDFQWVIDPIDGTKNYLAGTLLFGTLIALLHNGIPILGVINNPVTRQLLIGDGKNALLNDRIVKVRPCNSIEEATLLTTSHWSVWRYQNGPAFETLTKKVKLYRTWGDCYGYYLVATGYADIMIDPAMHLWDIAPLIPIMKGAGGRITDYFGNDPLVGEGAVATAGPMHDEVIQSIAINDIVE